MKEEEKEKVKEKSDFFSSSFDAATVAFGTVKQQSNRGGVAIQTIFLFGLELGKEKEEKEKEEENQPSSPHPTWRTQNDATQDNPELAPRSRRSTG